MHGRRHPATCVFCWKPLTRRPRLDGRVISLISSSMLGNILKPIPVSRRAYSVFSKPGGGRYFNSAKPPKVAPPTKGKVDASSGNTGNESTSSAAANEDVSPSSGLPKQAESSSFVSAVTPAANFFAGMNHLPTHPRISPLDLKLHQFFSLHRPLLLVSQPATSLFESSSSPFVPPQAPETQTSSLGRLDEIPEPSPEADADTARQLARALVVNRVGASLSWEDTLRRLGLDDTASRAEEVSVAQTAYEAYMDSTKRKRRRKMKKHK